MEIYSFDLLNLNTMDGILQTMRENTRAEKTIQISRRVNHQTIAPLIGVTIGGLVAIIKNIQEPPEPCTWQSPYLMESLTSFQIISVAPFVGISFYESFAWQPTTIRLPSRKIYYLILNQQSMQHSDRNTESKLFLRRPHFTARFISPTFRISQFFKYISGEILSEGRGSDLRRHLMAVRGRWRQLEGN